MGMARHFAGLVNVAVASGHSGVAVLRRYYLCIVYQVKTTKPDSIVALIRHKLDRDTLKLLLFIYFRAKAYP